jgi:hypothetical protein
MRLRPLFLALPVTTIALLACEREAARSDGSTANVVADVAPAVAPAPVAPGRDASLGFGAVAGRSATPGRSKSISVAEQAAEVPAPPDAAGYAGGVDAASRMQSGDPASRAAAGMVIRTGQASVQVDSLDVAVARVRQLAERVGGTIANSSLQSGRDQVRAATLEIRVAAPRFEELVAGLAPFGKVETVNVTAEDVGEEFVDLSARVTNARRLEARLIELLATRTGKLSDVLTVERELARVREEIERYEGRLRYLQARSAVSTLAVTVHEPLPILAGAPATNPIAQAFLQAWRNFVSLLAALIASLGVLIPLAALGLVVWIGLRRLRPVVVKPTT